MANKRAADEGRLVEEDYEKQPADEVVASGEHIPWKNLDAGRPQSLASGLSNPNVSAEEQNMEMEPQIVGPPQYGSPDPLTTQSRLVPLTDHPLAAENLGEDVESTAVVSEDYGQGYVGSRPMESISSASGVHGRTDLERATAGEGGDYDSQKVPELQELARNRGIEGYSSMNKKELVAAHQAFDEESADPNSGQENA